MTHNALLAHLKLAFGLDDAALVRLFALGGCPLDDAAVAARQRTYVPDSLTYAELVALLDGLIADRRGPSTRPAPQGKTRRIRYPNNVVLKKLRIAMDLKEEDTAATFAAGGLDLDHYAIGALFRQEGQSQFRACTDDQLLAFLTGAMSAR